MVARSSRASARALLNVDADVWETRSGQRRRFVRRISTHNLTVNAGLDMIRDLLAGDALGGITTFKVGTDNTAVVAGQTDLVASVHSNTVTSKTKGAQQLVVKYFLGSASANGHTLREAGLFNGAGTMYARVVLASDIVKTSSLTVTFTWTLTWSV
jgi:hypothetical protein